jgi:hypothetical protein
MAKILLSPNDIQRAKLLCLYDEDEPGKKKFKCSECSWFKANNRRQQLIHVAQDHLKKAATLEQLVPILILIWEKSETTAAGEKKTVYRCNINAENGEKCDFKLFASEDKGQSMITSHIKQKLKNKKELKVDVVKAILKKWKVELARVQCIPGGVTNA